MNDDYCNFMIVINCIKVFCIICICKNYNVIFGAVYLLRGNWVQLDRWIRTVYQLHKRKTDHNLFCFCTYHIQTGRFLMGLFHYPVVILVHLVPVVLLMVGVLRLMEGNLLKEGLHLMEGNLLKVGLRLMEVLHCQEKV